jgi:hypothetical protein
MSTSATRDGLGRGRVLVRRYRRNGCRSTLHLASAMTQHSSSPALHQHAEALWHAYTSWMEGTVDA